LGAGHVLTPGDLTAKRPGTGILPFELERVVGRRLAHGVDADVPLNERDLA
jgi:sialic acid synthase SpsE